MTLYLSQAGPILLLKRFFLSWLLLYFLCGIETTTFQIITKKIALLKTELWTELADKTPAATLMTNEDRLKQLPQTKKPQPLTLFYRNSTMLFSFIHAKIIDKHKFAMAQCGTNNLQKQLRPYITVLSLDLRVDCRCGFDAILYFCFI